MANPMQPESLIIHMYQVGFGDCFLLEFRYPKSDARFALIDFGTRRAPPGVGKNYMMQVAKQISEDCHGKLDVLVATHRHSDHISGFSTAAGGEGTGDVIAACRPERVLQPWTENPALETDATKPNANLRLNAAHVSSLRNMTTFAGEDEVKNLSAVKNLMAMGSGDKARYLKYGDSADVDDLLPGVEVSVLGPPTVADCAALGREVNASTEYWRIAAANALPPAEAARLTSTPRTSTWPPYARWFIPRVQGLREDQRLEIVTALDKALNNTSLILLFEVGGKKLLFPGDAQLENWSYAFGKADEDSVLRAALDGADIYKVGHHGSLNATPKLSLWQRFKKRGTNSTPGRLTTLLSTMDGVFKGSGEGEVPRGKLVAEIAANSTLIDTRKMPGTDLQTQVTVKLGKSTASAARPRTAATAGSRPAGGTSARRRRKA